MNNKPLISVIIPSYNRPTLLVRAIESVIDQSYPNVEIIVVDDASDIDIKPEMEKYPQVKLLRNSENKGACYSRNKGLKEAKGYYINFLDDDDIFLPGKLERQVACFEGSEDENLGMVTCHLEDERSGELKVIYNQVQGDIYKLLLYKYAVSGTETMLFRTSGVKDIGGFDERLESNQEYDLLIRFSEFHTVDFVNEVLTRKFRSRDQIHLNFKKKVRGAKYLYKKHNYRFKEIGFFFWLKMQFKLQFLLFRFRIGQIFGENAYRLLLNKK